MRWVVVVVLLGISEMAWAHPGRTDSCFGHAVKTAFHYACEEEHGDVRCPPSLPGEYHFHSFPYPEAEIHDHVLPPDAHGRLRLWCEKGNGERVEGVVRFREDRGISE